MVPRLYHLVAGHQKDWITNVHPLNYLNNTRESRSRNTLPYSLVLGRYSLEPTPLFILSDILTDIYGKNKIRSLQRKIEARVGTLRAMVGSHPYMTQKLYKHDYGRRVRKTPLFRPGTHAFKKVHTDQTLSAKQHHAHAWARP